MNKNALVKIIQEAFPGINKQGIAAIMSNIKLETANFTKLEEDAFQHKNVFEKKNGKYVKNIPSIRKNLTNNGYGPDASVDKIAEFNKLSNAERLGIQYMGDPDAKYGGGTGPLMMTFANYGGNEGKIEKMKIIAKEMGYDDFNAFMSKINTDAKFGLKATLDYYKKYEPTKFTTKSLNNTTAQELGDKVINPGRNWIDDDEWSTYQKSGDDIVDNILKDDIKPPSIIKDDEVTTEEPYIKKSQTVIGPGGEEITIPTGAGATEADLRKSQTGEQRYKSWDEFEKNVDKFDKSQPFYIGEDAFEKRYKWNEDKKLALLIDEDGNYLSDKAQKANQDLQEAFRGDQVVEKGIVIDEGTTPKEKVEQKIETSITKEKKEEKEEKYSPLEKGMYQDDEGNIWRKGDEGGWQVKYNRAAKGVPEVNEYGEPSFEMEFKYDKEWSTLSKDDDFDEPWTNIQQFESQLTPYSEGVYKGEASDIPTITTTEDPEKPGTLAKIGAGAAGFAGNVLEGAGSLLDAIGGPSAIISYVMGKKGLAAAMKEIKPQAMPELSPLFHQHLRQVKELSKGGFTANEERQYRKEIDNAYQTSLENTVRGTAGDRAKFLATSGVLDAKRSSALLAFSAKDAELQRANQDKYAEMMMFKENFDMQKSEKLRTEDMQMQLQNKKSAADFTSAAFSNLMNIGGGNSALINKMLKQYSQGTGSTNITNSLT
tara:strand:- start:2324 stop:4453 length:2130 start_codon:yes stop_codon:yes gene_type:complete